MVDGYLAIATEASCDDGCPHTLEHLIFMGSEDFPVKGMLDQLANRSFAQVLLSYSLCSMGRRPKGTEHCEGGGEKAPTTTTQFCACSVHARELVSA